MTTITLQRLNEQRLQKLKYRNVKWVTVPPTSYKFTPRYSDSALPSSRFSDKSASSKSSTNNHTSTKTPYFKTSEISFTEPETQILREADFTITTPSVQKKSSQLEQLQAQKIENDKFLQTSSSALSSKARLSQIQLIPSFDSNVTEITRSDSVVSFKPLELDDEDDSSKNDSNSNQNRDSGYNPLNGTTVTINDIKDHVWMWCHDNDGDIKKVVKQCNAQFIEQETLPEIQTAEQYQQQQQQMKYHFQQHRRQRQLIEKQKVHEQQLKLKQSEKGSPTSFLDESFYTPENRLLQAHYNYSPGEKRLRNIIKSHSKIEQDREEVKRRFQKKHIQSKDKEKIEASYCAYKYQKYLFDKVGDVPDFLDDVDFTEAKKVKANLRKNRIRDDDLDGADEGMMNQRTPRKNPK